MLTRTSLEARLRRIIAESAGIEADSFGLDDELTRSGVDSLSLLRAIAEVESELKIVIADEEFSQISTLRGLMRTIERQAVARVA